MVKSADILFWHSVWHTIVAFYLASILTFYSGFLAWFWHSVLALYMTCVRAQGTPQPPGTGTRPSTAYWARLLHSRRGVGSRASLGSWARDVAPQLRSGSAHWDLELAVEVQQCPLRSGVRCWGEEEWRKEGGSNSDKIRDPHRAGGEKKHV